MEKINNIKERSAITWPQIPDSDHPILMLNMLRFKDRRLYFEEYLPAFNKVVQKLGITGAGVVMFSNVLGNILADESEHWDGFLLVDYPSFEAFKTIAESKEYHELAEPLRVAALEELKLYLTRKSEI